MGKIIEFSGLPGSGKSILASMILTETKAYDNEIVFYAKSIGVKSLFPTILYMLTPIHLNFKFATFKLLLVCKSKKMFKGILKIIRFSMISWKNKRNYILSEGVVQNVFELLENCINVKQSSRVIEILNEFLNIHNNITLIFLNVDEDKSFSRIRERNSSHNSIDKLDDFNLKKILHKRKLYENEVISSLNGRDIFIIDSNGRNLEKIKNEILLKINNYL